MKKLDELSNKLFDRLIIVVAAFFFIATAVVFLSGCKTEQWAVRKIAKVDYHQPKVLPKYCGERFPPVVYDSTKVEYRKGETIVRTDTLTMFDTLTNTVNKIVTKTLHSTDTVTLERKVQVENKAALTAAIVERDELKVGIAKKQSQLSISLWCNIIFGVLLLIWLLKKFV